MFENNLLENKKKDITIKAKNLIKTDILNKFFFIKSMSGPIKKRQGKDNDRL